MSAAVAESLVLNIGDMIDLAIGTPEVGVVDFNMLQTVLHCLAQQQHILAKPVEVRGLSFPASRDQQNVVTVNVSEFAVGTDGKPPVRKVDSPAVSDTILVVERVKKTDSVSSGSQTVPSQSVAAVSAGAPSAAAVAAAAQAGAARKSVAAGQPGAGATSVAAGLEGAIGETGADGQDGWTGEAGQAGGTGQAGRAGLTGRTGQAGGAGLAGAAGQAGASGLDGLTLVTYSKFNLLENTVQDLQKRVYGSIPKNEDILEEVRSQTNIKAIQDMWTNMNVAARLEAAEAGIEKLSSLVQDMINETTKLQDAVTNAGLSEYVGTGPGAAGTDAAALAGGAPSTGADARAPVEEKASKSSLDDLTDFVNQIRQDLDNLTEVLYSTMEKAPFEVEMPPRPEPTAPLEEGMEPQTTVSIAPGTEISPVKSSASSRHRSKRSVADRGPAVPIDVLEVMQRLDDLEKRIDTCCKALGKEEGTITDQLSSFQDQLELLAKQVAALSTLASSSISPDLVKDLQGLMQLFQTVQEMQEQLKQVHETALELSGEKDDRKHHINVLLEQIELLKTIKLDREDMAEAMAEKADLRLLARKVSHDQFELACDDLSRGLEHALGKLNTQEALWQQALDDIQREIETKLDKMELSPMKEFFNNKLKMLQDSLKQMASLRREAEAAGTKRKLLRDLNCLSCDANAVMAAEAPPAIPVPKPFPAGLSMKPYLTYELDAIRKTQASNLPQRNMHDWENIDKQMTQPPKQPIKVRSSADKHICNRYCGGSHTTTTPAQRVARLGHFIKQWGPDVLPLSSGLAAGDDGRMYRVQAEKGNLGPDGAADICTPKVSKKPDLPQVASEKLLDDKCKCMDAPIPGASK